MRKKLIIKAQTGLNTSSFWSNPTLGGTKTNQSFWQTPSLSQSSSFNLTQDFSQQLSNFGANNLVKGASSAKGGTSKFASIKNWMGSEAAGAVAGQLGSMLASKVGGDGILGQALGTVTGEAAKSIVSSVASGGNGVSGLKGLASGNNLKGMGAGLAASQIGGLLGNEIGGDAGTVVSSVTGNLGSSIGTALSKGQTIGQGLKAFTSAGNLAGLGAGIGSALFDAHTAHSRYAGEKGDLAAGVDMAGSLGTLALGGGLTGALGGLGMSAVNFATGGTDGMTTQDALLGSGAIAGALTAANPFVGLGYIGVSAINSAFGSTSNTMKNTGWQDQEELGGMWGGYAGSHNKDIEAQKVAGKKYGLFSNSARHEANDKIDEANRVRARLLKISGKNEIAQIRGNKMIDLNNLQYQRDVSGGYDQRFNRIGKNGMKLPTKSDITKVREILSRKSGGVISIEAEEPEKEVQEFKDGGNIIPEGALHARKNNMEGAGTDFTHKGIPVVDKDGEQQAEIERDEIIFRKEVTNKLEELMKDGSDKAAVEAGKLLVEEIFNNTEDRTGLIASIVGEEPTTEEEELLSKMQKGGKTYKHWKKPDNWTEDKIPYNEWIKDLNPSEYQGNYDLETAYKYYPKEVLERWKWAATRPTEEEYNYFMDYKDENGENIYHLGSVAEIPGTEDFIFLKKGKEEDNDELHYETDRYRNGENGLKETHDLVFEGDRYYYRKKKTPKKAEGGAINLIEELNKISPEKLEKFSNILKYLNQ